MDTTTVVLVQQMQQMLAQQAEMISEMQQTAVASGGMNLQGDIVTIILAIIALIGGVWGFLKVRAEFSAQTAGKRIEAESKFNTQVLEKEVEENRSFQQSMVKSTQDSYISLVDRLMKFQENFMLDMKQDIVNMIQQVQRSGSISESVNKRLITLDKQFIGRHEELKTEINGVKDRLKELQERASISLHDLIDKKDDNTNTEYDDELA